MAAESLGGRLLDDVEVTSLEILLGDLRKLHHGRDRLDFGGHSLGIEVLDNIWARHGGRLEITGREGGLPLLYHIVSASVSNPRNGTIAVVDVDGRFDITRLKCDYSDLMHVHVFRPSTTSLKATLERVEDYMLYGGLEGAHASVAREWLGTIVSGGAGGHITCGWRGWLKVESEKEEVVGLGLGMSVEEAVAERDSRQAAVQERGWKAVSHWGVYRWSEV